MCLNLHPVHPHYRSHRGVETALKQRHAVQPIRHHLRAPCAPSQPRNTSGSHAHNETVPGTSQQVMEMDSTKMLVLWTLSSKEVLCLPHHCPCSRIDAGDIALEYEVLDQLPLAGHCRRSPSNLRAFNVRRCPTLLRYHHGGSLRHRAELSRDVRSAGQRDVLLLPENE